MNAVMSNPEAGHLASPASMQALLSRWAEMGWLRDLDVVFARFLAREVPDASPLLLLAAALVSHQLGRGHACLELAATLADPVFVLSLPPGGAVDAGQGHFPPLPARVLAGIALAEWQAALAHPQLVNSGQGDAPLVKIGDRLYLRRYWQYEQDVRAGIRRRLEIGAEQDLPIEALRTTLDALFPESLPGLGPDWQKLACALAARSAFSIVTGGPGTGKTTTVVRLLALLQSLALDKPLDARPLRIRLAAPTGKAAARLNESIAGAVDKLPLAGLPNGESLRRSIPVGVTTLHRLLGSRPDTRHFKYHAGNPLALDVLVVDEASMVDLEMMAAVLAALPASARLILLGDKDQLASVEAGSVLGELCARAQDGHYTPATRDWLHSVTGQVIAPGLVDPDGTPLDQGVAMLRHSFRFSAESGIGQLAGAVNAGFPRRVRDVLGCGYGDLAVVSLRNENDPAFRKLVIEGGGGAAGYRNYLEILGKGKPSGDARQADFDLWALKVLEAHGHFQVLCALRLGPWGVEELNLRIARWLHEAGLISAWDGWYCGRPVLVTRNDYGLGLMNGDIGIALELPGADGKVALRVAFPREDGGVKWLLPSRLQAVETVYALTVHKSQGSEFIHVALVLPDTLNPVLTRELIYTGITRAKKRFTLAHAGNVRVLEQAVERRVQRLSGLMADFGVSGS